MSKFLKSAALLAAISVLGSPAVAETYGLGRAALPEEIAAWNGDISADGTGLPDGSGDAIVGEELFAVQCAACHGDFAEGIGNWPKLAGGADTLDREDPLKTVGSYWPYLTTAFDYIKRSMPYGNAGTLSDDETYALVAYILYSNDLIEDDFVLSRESFFDVEMPNADGFILDDRAEAEYAQWRTEPCMQACKPEPVKITMRAMVLDVTPQEEQSTPAAPAVVAVEAAFDPDLAMQGEKVFRKCKACHQVGEGAKNRVGPMLTGIVGASAGAVDGFSYSGVMGDAGADGLIWSEAALAEFLENPKSYMKGTKMAFAGLKDEGDRSAVIEYLKSVDD